MSTPPTRRARGGLWPRTLALLAGAMLVSACKDASDDTQALGECGVIQAGEGRVIIGFWDNDACEGEPLNTNSFPVDAGAGCYCWPGHSGENSAQSFGCDAAAGSFTYDQFVSLDCDASGARATTKTSYTTRCEQDVPPTLYSKIVDFSACE